MTGIEAVTPTAAISPHRMSLLVENPAAATGLVRMSRLVRIRANGNSFQPPMKFRIATATRPGAPAADSLAVGALRCCTRQLVHLQWWCACVTLWEGG